MGTEPHFSQELQKDMASETREGFVFFLTVVFQLGINIMVRMVRGQTSCLFGSINELLMHLANYTFSWNNFVNYI